MTTAASVFPRLSPAGSPDAGRAVSRLAIRQIRRGGAIVVLLCAGLTALVAATYAQVMADPAAVGSLQTLAGNPAIRTLFGEPVGLDTAGGFTVWRVGTVTGVLLGTWSILATTRVTRGEEDTGRWDLLLAVRIPLRQVVLRHLAAVMLAPLAVTAGITGVLIVAGTSVPGALVHSAGTGLLGAFFVAVAILAAQIFPVRTPATGAAVALLGISLLIRMVGDGVADLGWLRWLSPFGLLALSGPYVHNRVLPLLILVVATAALVVAGIVASGRREVRGGLVPVTSGRRAKLSLLSSVEAFALRRVLRPLTGWAIGLGAYYLLIGLTAVSVTGFLADNPALTGEAAAAGFAELGSVSGFSATLFAVLAMPVGGFVTVRMAAFVTAETRGLLTPLASQPVRRMRLIGAEIIVTAAAGAAAVTIAGLATWTGVTVVGGGLPLAAALAGVWNTIPIILLSLGFAVMATGWAPRVVSLVGGLPTTGGFLLLVAAESIGAPDPVREISPFAHLAPVPLATVDVTNTLLMSGAALVLIVVGLTGYVRRDFRS